MRRFALLAGLLALAACAEEMRPGEAVPPPFGWSLYCAQHPEDSLICPRR